MLEVVSHYKRPLQNVFWYRLVVILLPLMNLVDVETERKFPIPPPPPKEEEENEVKPPPPPHIGPNGVNPTEKRMMIVMFKYTKTMAILPRSTFEFSLATHRLTYQC